MKLKLASAVFLAFFGWITTTSGQLAFGVSPGLGLNTAYFGYQVNDKVVPFIGIQYLNAKFNYEETDDNFSEETELSASLIVPSIGVKYFIKQQEKIQAYLSLSLAKPFVSGKLEYDGEEEEEFADVVENVKLFGAELGFGVEYLFDENFSIGGEFGLRNFSFNYESEDDEDFSQEVSLKLTPTYSKISLNYYF